MSVRPVVLVVDDERPVQRFLSHALEGQGYDLILAETGQEALSLAAQYVPDVVLLDLGLPDADGVDVCRELRTWYKGALIVVSARGDERSKVLALDEGADDYVTKPFGVPELLARLRAALRRAATGDDAEPRVVVGPLVIDLAARLAHRDQVEVRLTATEFKLLAVLARHAGKVVTQKQLTTEVWGPRTGDRSHDLRVYMAHLRKKLEPDPAKPVFLRTELGVGYRLVVPEGG